MDGRTPLGSSVKSQISKPLDDRRELRQLMGDEIKAWKLLRYDLGRAWPLVPGSRKVAEAWKWSCTRAVCRQVRAPIMSALAGLGTGFAIGSEWSDDPVVRALGRSLGYGVACLAGLGTVIIVHGDTEFRYESLHRGLERLHENTQKRLAALRALADRYYEPSRESASSDGANASTSRASQSHRSGSLDGPSASNSGLSHKHRRRKISRKRRKSTQLNEEAVA